MHDVDLTSEVFRNPRKQGDIGLSAAVYYFTRLGFEVFLPMTEATRADLIVVPAEGGLPQRIQCKTTRQQTSESSFTVSLVTKGGNRSWGGIRKGIDPSEVDGVFIWYANDSMWLFPAEQVSSQATVSLGWANRQYQVSGPPPAKPGSAKNASTRTCADCPTAITRKAVRCKRCSQLKRNSSKIDWPSVDEVRSIIAKEGSVLGAARVLGVSDNAVRRWLARREAVAA